MLRYSLLIAALSLTGCAPLGPSPLSGPPHPEARPFAAAPSAASEVDAALTRAAAANKRVILIFGNDACHDSRGLAGWFDTPRFAAMLEPRYEIVWIDIGEDRDRNTGLASRFGVAPVVGTPTVVIASADGKVLNAKDAADWRDAASRSEADIYAYFETWGTKGG